MRLKDLFNQAKNDAANASSEGIPRGSLKDQLNYSKNRQSSEGSLSLGSTLKQQLNNSQQQNT